MILLALRFVPLGALFQDDRLNVEDVGVLAFIFGCFWTDSFPAAELSQSLRTYAPSMVPAITDRLVDTGYLERLENENL